MTRHNTPAFSDYARYIGIPYREPDCEPDQPGLNCWELCEKIMIELFGIVPPTYRYKVNGSAIAPVFVTELEKWKTIDPADRAAGDLVLLNVAGYPIHIGIMLGRRHMIHTLRNIGSSCEEVTGIKWRKRVSGYYRWSPSA